MSKDLGAILAKEMGVNEEEQLAWILEWPAAGRAQNSEENCPPPRFYCAQCTPAR